MNTETNLPSRLKRAMKYQALAALVNSFVGAWAMYGIIWSILPDASDLIRLPLLLGVSYFVIIWLNQISLFFINLIVYKGKYKEMLKEIEHVNNLIEQQDTPVADDESQQTLSKIEITIVDRPDTPIGQYKGADIFEWLHVQGENKKLYHFVFDGVFDMDKLSASDIADDYILVPPGILYKLSSS